MGGKGGGRRLTTPMAPSPVGTPQDSPYPYKSLPAEYTDLPQPSLLWASPWPPPRWVIPLADNLLTRTALRPACQMSTQPPQCWRWRTNLEMASNQSHGAINIYVSAKSLTLCAYIICGCIRNLHLHSIIPYTHALCHVNTPQPTKASEAASIHVKLKYPHQHTCN